MTTFLTLNLRHGGASRIDALCAYLLSADADFTICSEFRSNGSGEALVAAMTAAGRRAFLAPAEAAGQNSVALFSREDALPVELDVPPLDRHRIVACRRRDGLIVSGVYFAQGKYKNSLFQYLLSRPFGDAATIVMGDFNTGLHRCDEQGATFICSDQFAALQKAGLTDLWRSQNGHEAREYSWYSRASRGFRIDHAFGSATVLERISSCRYDHSTRDHLTDHSALHLSLDGP